MKLALALTLFLLAPRIPFLPPQTSAHDVEASARVIDARTLEVVRRDASGERRSELTLADLPADARLHAVEAATYMDTGLVVALAIEVDEVFEYRFLLQREGDAGGARAIVGSPVERSDWGLSGALFTDAGAPYRIVDVHNPAGDSLELTLRRGVAWVQRDSSVSLDEVLIVDGCPSFGSAAGSDWVKRIQVSGRPL